MNLCRIIELRAGADATTGNRQAATSEVAANRARQRGNLTQFDCHAEGNQAAHAEQSAVGIPDIGYIGSRSEPTSQTAPPRRAEVQSVLPQSRSSRNANYAHVAHDMLFNLNPRSVRSLTKRPELNRDSFVFASTQLHKVKQLQ